MTQKTNTTHAKDSYKKKESATGMRVALTDIPWRKQYKYICRFCGDVIYGKRRMKRRNGKSQMLFLDEGCYLFLLAEGIIEYYKGITTTQERALAAMRDELFPFRNQRS